MNEFIEVYVKTNKTSYGYSSPADLTRISIRSIAHIKFKEYHIGSTFGCSIFIKAITGEIYELTDSELNENRGLWKSKKDAIQYIESIFNEEKQI